MSTEFEQFLMDGAIAAVEGVLMGFAVGAVVFSIGMLCAWRKGLFK
jgi:hypothetical protein